MPNVVRTTRLFQAQTFNGVDVLIYTCPAGKRSVLTDLNVSFGSVAPTTEWYLRHSSPGPIFICITPKALQPLTTYTVRSRWVLEEGESYYVTCNSALSDSCDMVGCGYELQLP